ncbi:MAG: SWIM zinc finger domain-containing protein [Gemmataceae bacterium]|nr:SWIM zinc finger domain-containing protein [Gemmataceae bacterium]
MIVQMRYAGRSAIVNGLRDARVVFATNRLREPTYFRGDLTQPVLFREGLAALYRVVVSDYKYRPRDRLEFRAWLEEQDRKFLESLGVKSKKAQQRLAELDNRLHELNAARTERLREFYRSRTDYFNFVYENEYERAYLFDPVVTVHPDEVSFEAFSRDESTYARLAGKYDLFANIKEFQCGTTNIDFSARLNNEMERMRTYRQTRFDVEPSGFTVTTDEAPAYKEKKIDLPETWVKGFLQVHSTMSLGLTRFHMAPVDLFNICRYLRRRKARTSPRALRYEFQPGKPVRAVLEPWEHVIELTAQSPVEGGQPLSMEMTPGALYQGNKPLTVRTWGRDRLQTLARLLPVCKRIDVFLAGHGLPSIYVLDLGPMAFTLALSGWTDNDWTGGAAKFDLLARRMLVSAVELTKTYEALKKAHMGTDGALASATGLGVEKCRSALSYLCQIGRAMYDLGGSVYRQRDLFPEPFTVKEAAAAVSAPPAATSPEEKAALAIFEAGNVFLTARRPVSTGYKLTGSAKGTDAVRVRPLLHVDHEGHIVEASCTCNHYKKYKMTRGPCEHVLALRLAHMARLEQEDSEGG